ncbi:flavin-containing monooxygenase [Ornithinimicrobium faecis]|uniref:flavin-containing monooxygenase n=1 Tax=Ornithinimicrobium faecis TaxID=2934158 RepID=UPI002119538B|nr:NAD(P)/FAD-dependent oxidoreductase [Ornithinimicrobium sp. HY1745]
MTHTVSSGAPIDPQRPSQMSSTRLASALKVANIPVLTLVLYQLTGERRWLEPPYRPRRSAGLDDNATGGLPVEVQEEVRRAAFVGIRSWMDGASMAVPEPPDDVLVEMLGVSMGEDVGQEYGPMIRSDLGLDEAREPDVTFPPGFEVLIIGTGLSGLVMAKSLVDAGVECRLVERAHELGGTWRDNRYPGCGVDTPSAIYSFSFSTFPWSRYFAERDEVQEYLKSMAKSEGLLSRIDFDRDVVEAMYDAESQRWHVNTQTSLGETVVYSPDVVISAVGVFSEMRWPDVPGLRDFTGELVHTADWDEDVVLAGRRVGVIGNGASAMQLVPAVVDDVEHLTIFQRSPHWVAPFPQFQGEVPDVIREFGVAVPLYRRWYRVRAGWTFNDRLHSSLQRDPDWTHPERSVNARNDEHRKFFTSYLDSKVDGREDLREALLPTYPPFGKRILLDNGWFDAVRRPHVTLETKPISHVDGDRVVVEGEEGHQLEVLVCATGFQAVRFLSSMSINGRDGVTLREVWGEDDARAYLGSTVPGFPNFFIMYGPNVQAGHGGSLVGLAEMQSHYIVDALRALVTSGSRSIEVKRDVWERYNEEVDRAHDAMVWAHPGMSTYYRNSRGRVVVPGPFRVVDLWHRTRHVDTDDYIMTPHSAQSVRP